MGASVKAGDETKTYMQSLGAIMTPYHSPLCGFTQ